MFPTEIIVDLQRECNDVLVSNGRENNFHNNDDIVKMKGCIFEPTNTIPSGFYQSKQYIDCRNKCVNKQNQLVSSFLLGDAMKNLLSQLTTSTDDSKNDTNKNNSTHNIYLINEQYIVKPSHSIRSSFVWHQDSQYLENECTNDDKKYDSDNNNDTNSNNSIVKYLYLSLWIPLDDIKTKNGSLYFLPFDDKVQLDCKAWKNTQIANEFYFKQKELQSETNLQTLEKSQLYKCRASIGDMIVFTSYTWHKSNPNVSNKIRRVFMPQYSISLPTKKSTDDLQETKEKENENNNRQSIETDEKMVEQYEDKHDKKSENYEKQKHDSVSNLACRFVVQF